MTSLQNTPRAQVLGWRKAVLCLRDDSDQPVCPPAISACQDYQRGSVTQCLLLCVPGNWLQTGHNESIMCKAEPKKCPVCQCIVCTKYTPGLTYSSLQYLILSVRAHNSPAQRAPGMTGDIADSVLLNGT